MDHRSLPLWCTTKVKMGMNINTVVIFLLAIHLSSSELTDELQPMLKSKLPLVMDTESASTLDLEDSAQSKTNTEFIYASDFETGNTTTTTTIQTTPTTTVRTTPPPNTSTKEPPPPRNVTPFSCQNVIQPIGHCNFSQTIFINSTFPCAFECWYNPNQMSPVRLEVHLRSPHGNLHPTFVTAQQTYNLNAWTLPIIFPSYGKSQMFTSIEEVLCPPISFNNLPITMDNVKFKIETQSPKTIELAVAVSNISYVLKKGDNVTVAVTAVSPWYKLYEWADEESSVLITADSVHKNDTVCAIFALQNAKCPVYTDEAGLRAGGGRYQTFTSRAGIVARRDEFPDGVHMIVKSLPDDVACTLADTESHQSSRKKSVILEVFGHATIWSTWYIFVITLAIMAAIIGTLTKLALMMMNRNFDLNGNRTSVIGDEAQLLEESSDSHGQGSYTVQQERGIAFMPYPSSNFTGADNQQQQVNGNITLNSRSRPIIEEELAGSSDDLIPRLRLEGDEDSALAIAPPLPLAYAPHTTYAPRPPAMNFTESFNPRFVLWWKTVAIYEAGTAESQVSEVGFQNSLLIMAVFAALPTTELIRSYLAMLMYHGQEDQCFFNSRCLTAFGFLHDFSRFFTNFGYVLTGIAYVIIVKKHQRSTHAVLNGVSAKNTLGVSHHYGLFVSLGYGLIIQGIMSALYHSCPNSVTIRFDMMFMYVVSIAAVVSIWGLRHGDVTHHIYPTMALVGGALLMAELREWVSKTFFWSGVGIIYSFLLITTTTLMARFGIWSFSPYRMFRVWQGWKPVMQKLENVIRDTDRTSRPLEVIRILVGFSANLFLMIYAGVMDPNVYSFILGVCLVNMGLYFGNYIVTKAIVYREKGTALAWVSLFVSSVLWIVALITFFYHSTDSEASPSSSRAMNTKCDFLDVYDMHDAWHLLSSLALFTFFVGILTLDDDLAHQPSISIPVF